MMKRILIAAATLSLLAGSATAVSAQPRPQDRHDNDRHDNHGPSMAMHGPSHADWRKGGHIARNDWNRGQRVSDWRNHHLNAPPRGYEWRRVDNNYVLAAVTTGLIASIILANQ